MKTIFNSRRALVAAVFAWAALSAARTSAGPQSPNAGATPTAAPSTPVTTGGIAAGDASSSSQDSTAAPKVVPEFSGSFRDGLEKVRQHALKRELEPALGIAAGMLAPNAYARWRLASGESGGVEAYCARALDPLAESQGWLGYPARARAEVHYSLGVALRENERPDEAAQALESARADAGAGPLRLDAIAALGCLKLAAAEAQRALIPEISGQPSNAQPGMPAVPGGAAGSPSNQGHVPAPGTTSPSGPGSASEPPDPLQLARAAYLAAREHFIERLRADWRDRDTQAHTELVQKRLRELEEIEKKREEQKKEQEQQDKEQKDQQDKEKDDKEKQDQKDQKNDKPEGSKDPPPDPKEQDKKEEPKEEPKDEKPKPEDAKKDEKKPEPKPGEPQKQDMSKEEMTQLLDRLQQIEEQWKKLQEQLKNARRVRVPKDW